MLDLQVHRGKKRATRTGLFLGMLGGAAFGAVSGALCDHCNQMRDHSRGVNALIGTVVWGILGMPIGALAGAVIKVDRWEPGGLSPDLGMSPTGAGGMSVGISLRVPSRH